MRGSSFLINWEIYRIMLSEEDKIDFRPFTCSFQIQRATKETS